MNWAQFNGDGWRRSFTTVLLGVMALLSLFICSYSHQADTVVKIGLLVITMSCLLLMFFLLLENLKTLGIKNENKVTGKTEIRVSSFKGEQKPIKTVIGFVPERNKSMEISEEERLISAELKKIVGDRRSPSDCLRGLDLLAAHESTVRTSWTQTLNKARLLQMIGRTTEAEGLANGVIEQFSDSGEAVGTAYEVLSWIEEFREPKDKAALYRRWLEKRKLYVMKGLSFFPTGHDLLMNAFEVATLQASASEALGYLNRAASVDKELTQKNLAVNPKTEKAARLSTALRETIEDLIEGDNKMKIFEMVRVRLLFLVITSTLSLSAGTLYQQTKELSHHPVSVPAVTSALPEAVKSFAAFAGSDGTSFGRAGISLVRGGTGFGQQ